MGSTTDNSSQREPTEVAYKGCLVATGAGAFVTFAVLFVLTLWQIITSGLTALMLATAVVFALFSVGGVGLLVHAWRRNTEAPAKKSFRDNHQRGALRVARKKGGRVTVADIAVETTMNVDEAEAVLEEFARRGVADLSVTESGSQLYVFSSFGENADEEMLTEDERLSKEIEEAASSVDSDASDEAVFDLDEDSANAADADESEPAEQKEHKQQEVPASD